MLIGLNGRLKAGKDTTYDMINKIVPRGAERVSFAEPLKRSAAAAIGVDVETLEMLKGREDLKFSLNVTDSKDFLQIMESRGVPWIIEFNVRQYLQWYGTEAHREIFGDNFWVNIALPKNLDHSKRLLVVTDMRFPNEVERVKELGGITVKVERETATAHAAHASEQNIDHMIDYFLDNTGNLDDLYTETFRMLHRMNVVTSGEVEYAL